MPRETITGTYISGDIHVGKFDDNRMITLTFEGGKETIIISPERAVRLANGILLVAKMALEANVEVN